MFHHRPMPRNAIQAAGHTPTLCPIARTASANMIVDHPRRMSAIPRARPRNHNPDHGIPAHRNNPSTTVTVPSKTAHPQLGYRNQITATKRNSPIIIKNQANNSLRASPRATGCVTISRPIRMPIAIARESRKSAASYRRRRKLPLARPSAVSSRPALPVRLRRQDSRLSAPAVVKCPTRICAMLAQSACVSRKMTPRIFYGAEFADSNALP